MFDVVELWNCLMMAEVGVFSVFLMKLIFNEKLNRRLLSFKSTPTLLSMVFFYYFAMSSSNALTIIVSSDLFWLFSLIMLYILRSDPLSFEGIYRSFVASILVSIFVYSALTFSSIDYPSLELLFKAENPSISGFYRSMGGLIFLVSILLKLGLFPIVQANIDLVESNLVGPSIFFILLSQFLWLNIWAKLNLSSTLIYDSYGPFLSLVICVSIILVSLLLQTQESIKGLFAYFFFQHVLFFSLLILMLNVRLGSMYQLIGLSVGILLIAIMFFIYFLNRIDQDQLENLLVMEISKCFGNFGVRSLFIALYLFSLSPISPLFYLYQYLFSESQSPESSFYIYFLWSIVVISLPGYYRLATRIFKHNRQMTLTRHLSQ